MQQGLTYAYRFSPGTHFGSSSVPDAFGRHAFAILATPFPLREPGNLLKKLLRDPITASRARSLLAYLSELWLRHHVRFAHVSLHQGRAFWLRHHVRFVHVSLHQGRAFWLGHNVRFVHVSLHRNSCYSFSRRSLRGSLHSGRSLRFVQQTAKSDRLLEVRQW